MRADRLVRVQRLQVNLLAVCRNLAVFGATTQHEVEIFRGITLSEKESVFLDGTLGAHLGNRTHIIAGGF